MKDTTKLSFMDFKVPYDKGDRELAKYKLIDEIDIVRQTEIALARSSKGEKRHQNVGTDLKNVTADIVYRNEHGHGVLKH